MYTAFIVINLPIPGSFQFSGLVVRYFIYKFMSGCQIFDIHSL